jgi:hypothetical protein
MANKAKDGAEGGVTATKKLSDMEAVRRSMNELGYDTETQKLHEHILSRYGKNLNNNKISAYKSGLRRKAGMTKSRGKGRHAAVHVSALRIEDVQSIKELVSRLGAGRVRELIDVLH